MERKIKVEGMHCRSCEMLLMDIVSEIKGVQKVTADFKKGVVTVSAADAGAIEEAKKAIAREGYKVVG